jgi:hypothetical protein
MSRLNTGYWMEIHLASHQTRETSFHCGYGLFDADRVADVLFLDQQNLRNIPP